MLARAAATNLRRRPVQAALDWLAANQGADGRWDCSRHGGGRETQDAGHDRGGAGGEADTGITGPGPPGVSRRRPDAPGRPLPATVQRGLEFLLRSQAADGNLAGNAELFARMYCHGMATLALSEAYAMTGDQRLRPYVDRALQLHAPRPASDRRRLALPARRPGRHEPVRLAADGPEERRVGRLPIPAQTRAGMIRFLNSCHRGAAARAWPATGRGTRPAGR